MKKKTALMLILFVMLIGIISSSGMFKTDVSEALPTNNYETLNSLKSSNLKTPENEPPWWNLTYHYRKPITLTEPGYLDRINEPVEVEVNFDSEKAYKNSLRLLYYDEKKNKWIGPLPIQLSETTFDPNDENHIKSTKITFLANVSKGKTETYYLYYTDYSVEEKIYRTDIYANESMIANSYLTWWINPPKIFRYPNETGVDWNTIDDGWIGYRYSNDYWGRGGGCLSDESRVTIQKNQTLNIGPVYAKVWYRYKVITRPGYDPNIYDIVFTIYAKNPIVKVDMDLVSIGYGSTGLWGTVMDVEGTAEENWYAFYRSSISSEILDYGRTVDVDEPQLKDINDWTWAVLYHNDYGVGVIANKEHTTDYAPLLVSRGVGGSGTPVYGHAFIFAYINTFPATYYYRFFKVPLFEDPWLQVNETTVAIAYPLSGSVHPGIEAEAS